MLSRRRTSTHYAGWLTGRTSAGVDRVRRTADRGLSRESRIGQRRAASAPGRWACRVPGLLVTSGSAVSVLRDGEIGETPAGAESAKITRYIALTWGHGTCAGGPAGETAGADVPPAALSRCRCRAAVVVCGRWRLAPAGAAVRGGGAPCIAPCSLLRDNVIEPRWTRLSNQLRR